MLVLVYLGDDHLRLMELVCGLPSLLRSVSGTSNFLVGLLSAIPYLATVVAMVLVGMHSDRTGERRWHLAGLRLRWFAHLGLRRLFDFNYRERRLPQPDALDGAFSMNGPFWATTTEMLSETSATAGIALINSFGNLGGFLGPYTIGLIRTWTGSFRGGLLAVGTLFGSVA